MDPLVATAASGLRSRMEALDLLANNLANTATAGFKADIESYNLYFGDSAWDGYNEGRPPNNEMPVVEQNWTDFSQGPLLETANPLDFALTAAGFFVVNTPGGPLYTRNGHFRLSKTGRLETQEGYPVQSRDGQDIVLDTSQNFSVDKNGQITQQGNAVAELEVISVDRVDKLTKRGSTYFQVNSDAKPSGVAEPEVAQGRLESSNAPAAQAAVKLVSILRQFEMLQKAVNLAGQMNQRVFDEVAKVSP
jgi:flagellar basal-body rod protein FlgF